MRETSERRSFGGFIDAMVETSAGAVLWAATET
jgi:hypothetical protein